MTTTPDPHKVDPGSAPPANAAVVDGAIKGLNKEIDEELNKRWLGRRHNLTRVCVFLTAANATGVSFVAGYVVTIGVAFLWTSLIYSVCSFIGLPPLLSAPKTSKALAEVCEKEGLILTSMPSSAPDNRSWLYYLGNMPVTTQKITAPLLLPESDDGAKPAVSKPPVGEFVSIMTWDGRGHPYSIKLSLTAPAQSEQTTTEVVFFERTVNKWEYLLSSFTVATPGSIHAWDKSIHSYFDELLKAPSSGVSAIQIEEDARRSIEAKLLRVAKGAGLDRINKEVSGSRRLNGYIQASTAVIFWALMIQIICRLWINYYLEEKVRSGDTLQQLWPNELASGKTLSGRAEVDWGRLKQSEIRSLRDIAKRACDAISGKLRVGDAHLCPTYLELHRAAADAYLVAGDYASVPAFVEATATTLADRRAASLGFIKFLIWSIPTVGFIGTVVGIGDALLETVNVDSANIAEAAIAKSSVSSNIGVAFDTTLVALVLSLVGMLMYHLLVQCEDLVVVQAKQDAESIFVQPGEKLTAPQLEEALLAQLETQHSLNSMYRRYVNDIAKATAGICDATTRLTALKTWADRIHRGVWIIVVTAIAFAIACGILIYVNMNTR